MYLYSRLYLDNSGLSHSDARSKLQVTVHNGIATVQGGIPFMVNTDLYLLRKEYGKKACARL